MHSPKLSNLRTVPHFIDTITDRCWHAWWTDTPVPIDEYRSWVAKCVTSTGVPQTFVAHNGERYLGSVALITSDMDSRPQYAPWIAALWVEETARRQGIAEKLIHEARAEAQRCGHHLVYLCAEERNSPYYRKRGFTQIETDVNGLNVFTIATSEVLV